MRRRSSTPSVTLFPFLAVLVCTMGALIFLLLVITQKIQKQSQLPVAAIDAIEQGLPDRDKPEYPVVQSVEQLEKILGIAEPILEETEESEFFDDDEPILPLLAGNSLEENELLKADWDARQAQLKAEYEQRVSAALLKQTKLDAKWTRKAKILEADLRRIDEEQKETQALQVNKIRELAVQKKQRDSLLNNLNQLKKQLSLLNAKTEQEKSEAAQLQKRAAELTRQIARLEEKLSTLPPETEIVAYDSLTGTSRKPILIECRSKEIVFVAEGVVLTAQDLSGFPPEYNPLKAGAEALVQFWSDREQNSEKPYILLVVRPEGTTGFYIARGLLSKMDHHFGYELVDTKTDIRWSETDPEAVRACEEAVADVIRNRARVAAKTGRLAATRGPLNYSNREGEFHIPELNGRDRSKKGSFLGDDKWLPPKREEQTTTPQISATHPQSQQRAERERKTSDFSKPLQNRNDMKQHGQPELSQNVTQRVFDFEEIPEARNVVGQPNKLSSTNAKPIGRPPVSNPLPVNPFETHSNTKSEFGGSQSGIQIPQKQGVIGIERELEIHLWEDRIQIDESPVLNIPQNTDTAEVKQRLTQAVSDSTDGWGQPPAAYFWKPVVKIVIHPGGLLHYPKAKELTKDWEVPSRIEYELK